MALPKAASLGGRYRRPPSRQVKRDRIEGLRAHHLIAPVPGEDDPASALEPVDLESPREWIDEPEVRDPLAGVDAHLAAAVDATRRRRDDLADPVGRLREVRRGWERRHALTAPAGPVGNQDVVAQVQLGLEDDPPAPGTGWVAGVPVEGPDQVAARYRGGVRVRRSGARGHEELAVDDLGDLVIGDLHQ